MNKKPFGSAPILLPDVEDLSLFSVIACDQYSSAPEYWEQVVQKVGDQPSALNFILPEAWLNTDHGEKHLQAISENMEKALNEEFFREYPDSYIYVERTMANGSIRQGLIGMIDLEEYDYRSGSSSPIRSTEATILERIPPRVKIRQNAPLELPHILLLADDDQNTLFSKVEKQAHSGLLPLLYDFDLMLDGGHIQGWLIEADHARAYDQILDDYQIEASQKYPDLHEENLVFVVGDGNHSLATAKTIWEQIRESLSEEEREAHPARFALAELENIHHESQQFEPIHRIIKNTNPDDLIESLKSRIVLDLSELEGKSLPADPFKIEVIRGSESRTFYLNPECGELACGILQSFLDDYLKNGSGEIDYIHGREDVEKLAAEDNSVGFILPAISKASLFRGVIADGSLPRKTFSMGHASEKRYYLEGKKIR